MSQHKITNDDIINVWELNTIDAIQTIKEYIINDKKKSKTANQIIDNLTVIQIILSEYSQPKKLALMFFDKIRTDAPKLRGINAHAINGMMNAIEFKLLTL